MEKALKAELEALGFVKTASGTYINGNSDKARIAANKIIIWTEVEPGIIQCRVCKHPIKPQAGGFFVPVQIGSHLFVHMCESCKQNLCRA